MNVILSILISLTALFVPASQPSTAPVSAPATFTLPSALTVQCEEDQPCWDCHTMGNRICDITSDATMADAWNTLDLMSVSTDVWTTVDYSRTLDNDGFILPMDEFAVESATTPGHWHIFKSQPTAQPTAQPATEDPTAAQPTASTVQAQPVQIQPAQPTARQAQAQPAQPAQPTAQPANQSTANTVPARKEDVPLGGAWAGMSLHYAQPTTQPTAPVGKGHTTPVTDSNPLPTPHAEPNPTAPRICVDTLHLDGSTPANECK